MWFLWYQCLASAPGYMFKAGWQHWDSIYISCNPPQSALSYSCIYTPNWHVLNTSDHLPLTATLLYEAISVPSSDSCKFSMDWLAGIREEWDKVRVQQNRLTPALGRSCMMTSFRLTKHVARLLVNSAEEAYLLTEPTRKTRWKDEVLSHMCKVFGEMLVHPQLVVETCVLPVLRMTVRIRSCLQVILSYLKPFYGKWQFFLKQVLKLPKPFFNTAAVTA